MASVASMVNPAIRVLAFASAMAMAAPPPVSIERRFAEVKDHPAELYAFLLRMPKGGDLHNHLSGAVYAESYLRAAAEDGLCIDTKELLIVAPPVQVSKSRCGENGVEASIAQSDNTLASAVIN